MHCSRSAINRRNAAITGSDLSSSRSTRAKKLPLSCTNRLRASQIAASLLVDADEGFRMMAHGDTNLAIGDKVTASFRPFVGRLVPYFEKT